MHPTPTASPPRRGSLGLLSIAVGATVSLGILGLTFVGATGALGPTVGQSMEVTVMATLCGAPIGHLLGLVLGVAGLLTSERKVASAIGVLMNTLVAAGVAILVLLLHV